MKKYNAMKALCLILIIYTLLFALPISSLASEYIPTSSAQEEDVSYALSDNVRVGSRLWELFFGEKKQADESCQLVPGGQVFGMKIKQKYVTVVESTGVPALKSGDIILSINGNRVESAKDVKQIVENSGGESVTIRALHGTNEIGVEIRPTYRDGEYRLGLSLRDGAAGLGTVTFFDPQTGIFGGLGHGICDSESGEVILMDSGEVRGVILGGIHKGETGKPGELCGVLTDRDLGDLTKNSECGVFGVITDSSLLAGNPISIGSREELVEGEATIISTLKNGKSSEYKIEIYDIDRDSTGPKSFRIRVTDEALKAITGGIVRGMSGSPIIQNGKLVGAVTHVLINDPTSGYGIFIENMLNAAQMPMAKAA